MLLKVYDIIVGYGAEVAFPTSTVQLPDGLRVEAAALGEVLESVLKVGLRIE